MAKDMCCTYQQYNIKVHINPVSWVSYIKPKSHPIFAQSLINLSLGLLYTPYPQLRAHTCNPLQELFPHSDLEQFSPKNYIIESLLCFVEHLWQLYIYPLNERVHFICCSTKFAEIIRFLGGTHVHMCYAKDHIFLFFY